MSGQQPHTTFPHRRSRQTVLLIAILISCMFCSSCGIGIFTRKLFCETLDIHVAVQEVANNEFPLAMDVVYVYDEKAFREVLQMTAKEWFDKRAGLLEGPDAGNYESWSWEWSPGQDTLLHLPLRQSVEGAIIFANYFVPGQHRVRIEPFQDVRIDFAFDDMKVQPL